MIRPILIIAVLPHRTAWNPEERTEHSHTGFGVVDWTQAGSLVTKHREATMNTRSEKLKRSMSVLVKDLELLASLYLAHFIVWRELRRAEREGDARRRNFAVGRLEV